MNDLKIKILIYLLALISILTVNIYLPAMPFLQHTFNTDKSTIALTVSFYMLGLAIGIPLYGAISDYIAVKKVLIIGLLIYISANILAFLSSNITVFIFARSIQGLGAASALCLWQVLTFKYFKQKAKHIIASGFIIIGAMPALAPVVGGAILAFINWRIIFLALTLLASLLILLTLNLPKHIKKINKNFNHKQAHIVISIFRQYKSLFLDSKFMVLTLASATIYVSLYVYLSEVPFLLSGLHYTTRYLSLFFIPVSIAFIIGGILSKLLLKKRVQFIVIFSIVVVIYLFTFILVALTEIIGTQLSGVLLAIPFFIITIGSGMGIPVIVAQALSLQPQRTGTAASAIGLTQNFFAFIFSGLGAFLTKYHYTGLMISYGILSGLLSFWFIIYIYKNITTKVRSQINSTCHV